MAVLAKEIADTPKKFRGSDKERREAILDCAAEVFLAEGFQAASMSAIAQRVGGSKGTLYNYFPSKEELFLACVDRHCEILRGQMSSLLAQKGEAPETLMEIGRRYVAFVSSDDTVRKFRMVLAEADRAPEIAREFYEMGPARGAGVVAGYLEGLMQEGKLRDTDPIQAAHVFFGLCYHRLSKARLCNAAPAPDRETIERDVAEAVRIFLLAYAP